MKREYLDYKPLIKQEKKVKENKSNACPFTGLKHPEGTKFVEEDIFKLMFGFDYPKSYIKNHYVETIRYTKNAGSNGKYSRFR